MSENGVDLQKSIDHLAGGHKCGRHEFIHPLRPLNHWEVDQPIPTTDIPDPDIQLASSPEHEGAVEDVWDSDHDDPATLIQVRRLTRGMRQVLQEAGIAAQ